MLIITSLLLFTACFIACSNDSSHKIKGALLEFTAKTDPLYTSVEIDSILYSPADSSVYYAVFLKVLEDRSESYSKMARLRTNLAQAHMNNYLGGEKKENFSEEKVKSDVDKSIEALKQNEREWNLINDSMDILLNAIHRTDTLKKVFYNVSYVLKAKRRDTTVRVSRKALLTRDDGKVVLMY